MLIVWITLICTLTIACLWAIMSPTGAGKDAFAPAFTTTHIKVLILTTTVNSSALTLTSIMVKIMFWGTFFMTATFTDALVIENVMWWTLWIRRAFTVAVVKVLDLWFFAKFEPAITVTNCLVKKLWEVACLLMRAHTFT